MAKKGCKRAPEINGELSTLYLDTFQMLVQQKHLKPEVARVVTNVLYTQYESNSQIKDALDNNGSVRNSQNQHDAADVFQILNGDELVRYTAVDELDTLSIAEGIKLNTVHSVEFNDWQTAYQKAHDINTIHPQLSAYVVQRNGKYIVKASNMTPLNMVDRMNTEIEIRQMQLIESALASKGLDLKDLSFVQDTHFGKKFSTLVGWLKNTPYTAQNHPDVLMKKDIKMLVSLHQREPIIDRLITKYGDIDTLVDTYYDWYRNNITVTPTTATQLKAGMDLMSTFNGLDVDKLAQDSTDLTDQIKQNNSDYAAQQLYDKLNAKYKLGQISIETSKDRLSSISEVLAQTIKTLGHQAVALKAQGMKQASQDLYDKIRILDHDLEQKENTSGLVEFLNLAASRLHSILNDLVTQIPQGADMTFINERGTALRTAAQFLEVYQPIISSLASMNSLDRDIDITDADAQLIANEASNLQDTISDINTAVRRSIDAWARQALSLMLGENSDITIDDVMDNMKQDATWFDKMYNATKVSHIPTAVLANYIQTTRRLRTQRMVDIAARIGAIVNQVDPVTGKRSFLDTKFMYEKVETEYSTKKKPQYEYRVVSEYDWTAFNKAKGKEEARLRKRGIGGQAFDLAMERWLQWNTDEIVIPMANGAYRTERVPKMLKADNPLDKLSPAERKAYDEFIELKKDLDSMLPEFARNLYIPPQVRMSAIDQLGRGFNVWKAVKEKFEKDFIVREDEVGLGIQETDTGDIISPYTDMTGSQNVVPVNYVTKLKEQDDLLQNFAEGISLLASSAINYDTMKDIVDTVEVLGDYIIDKVSPVKEGADMAQSFTYGTKLFYERIKTGKNSRVAQIIEDQKKRLVYNDHTVEGSSAAVTKQLAVIRKITSINALTFNLFGAINNALEGYRKNLEESLVYGTHTFDLVDLEYAHFKILKDHVGKSGSILLDFFSGKKNSLGAMIMDRFDPKKEKFHEIANKKYRTNIFRKAVSKDLTMIGYSIGETLNNMPIVYAMLHHIKVDINGKQTHLADAFERIPNGDGSYRLSIKAGTRLKDTGELVTEEYLDEVARKINEVSESNHGGMSEEAMGQISSTIMGMMTLQLRRWMIGVYSNYFRGEYYDASTGKKREGAWKGIYDVTFAPMIEAAWHHMPWSDAWSKDVLTFKEELIRNYKNLQPHQRLAATRWLTATALMTVLSVLTDALLKNYYMSSKDEEWFKVLFYLLSRQKMDVASTVPDLNHIERVGDVGKSLIEIMDKPFASYSTVKTFTYPISGLPELGEEIQQGPHKGEDRYWRNIRKYYWKPGELWNRIEGLSDTDELINSLGGLNSKYSAKKEYEKLTGEEVKDKKKSGKKKNKW